MVDLTEKYESAKADKRKLDISDCGKYHIIRLPKEVDDFLYSRDRSQTLIGIAKKGMGIVGHMRHWGDCNVRYCGERVTVQLGMSNGDGWELSGKDSLMPSIGGRYHCWIRNGWIEFLSDSKFPNKKYELESLA